MKRFLLLIGMVAMLTSQAEAQQVPVGLSPYVSAVLERADRGIDSATNHNVFITFFMSALGVWSRDALTPVMSGIDTDTQVLEQSRQLLEANGCMRADIAILEGKLEQVRQLLNSSLASRDLVSVLMLTDLYGYLQERIAFFIAHQTDPETADKAMVAPRVFDPSPKNTAPLCAFDSDTTPVSPDGFGCDASALTARLEVLPSSYTTLRSTLEKERDAALQLEAAASEYLRGARTLKDIVDAVDTVTSGGTPGASTMQREHQRVNGCSANTPAGIVMHSLRDPFSLLPNDLRLTLDFLQLKLTQEEERPLPEGLQQYSAGDWFDSLRAVQGETIRNFTRTQAEQESALFIQTIDARSTIEKSLASTLRSTGTLGTLAQAMDGGLRGYVRDFAYFLRRSCMSRPCNARLEQILKIIFTDACFPYTSGEYLKDTEEKTRGEKCREAAGLGLGQGQ